ncbi:MAG: histidine phosphatase family protein [Okeania sp. SIO3I5]|uniref:histidine phosphatase family protein n=1 Tax=Okeania sp. SIO3I5 TaxID=2607805 RepID=UPI0013B74B78|nr:histidine phosphatase family protein [Okeania sp. SIO3I5]NEQ38687.1 histidine phosphatase family protein [Okeania sp. SIO3I5]
MSLKLYFIRHGETTYSKAGGYCGILDPELTPEGAQMAEQFAQNYSSLNWTAAYVSPMKRTIATAKPLCDAVGLEMQLRDGLKEIYYGEWEGKTPETVNRDYHDDYVRWLTDPGWNSPIGGEKGIDIARRSAQVIQEIQDNHQTGNVLVVSHKATIRIMLCDLLGIDIGRFRDRIIMLVGGVSIVEMGPHGPLLHCLSDRCYLDEKLRYREGS